MRRLLLSIAAFAALLATSVSAGGLLVPRDGTRPLGMSAHDVHAVVEDGLARTTVRQTFVNPHARPLEAVYMFPLPAGAALVDVALEAGGQRLEGLLAERQRARRVYDEIVRREKDPALVEQIGASTFRLSVYPVLPGAETVVELTWIEHLPLVDGAFHYVYPLAVGAETLPVEQALTVAVELRSSVPFGDVTTSSEQLEVVRRAPGEARCALELADARLDEDLVVTGRVQSAATDLAVECFRAADGDGWFRAVLTPPPTRPDQAIPRDVVLVIDTSGSMASEGKIEQARESARWLLQHLRPIDRVNVLLFSSGVRAFAEACVDATPEHLAALREFVDGIEAKGGTALGDALLAAAKLVPAEGRVGTLVLLTDGKPTIGTSDRAELLQLTKGAGEHRLRTFAFGAGSDVDGALLRGLASAGRGRAELFRPGGEIATRLTGFLARTATPALTDVTFEVEGVATYDLQPRAFPDVYLGEQLLVTGRYRGGADAVVRATANAGSERETVVTRTSFRAEPGGRRSVAQLHARQELDFLEEARRLRLGLGDDAYYAALDAGSYSTEDEIVAEMIDVSLEHGVQCAYTSFLVLLPEDRARVNQRDAEALQAAVERAALQRREAAREAFGEARAPADVGVLEEPLEDFEDDPDFLSDSPFDERVFDDSIGLGGGAGGRYGGRFGGKRNTDAGGGVGSPQALADALEWLARHQHADGHWDADAFCGREPASEACGGAGLATSDVGVTGLALLALLGDGHTPRTGRHRDAVTRGVAWLREQQDLDTGLVGEPLGHAYLYDHAIATTALCEAYYTTKSPLLRSTAQRAVELLLRARNPYGVWRYDLPPTGDNDTSITGWCVLALRAADDAGLRVDTQAFADVLAWLDEVTDPATGRVGYDSRGSRSSRIVGINDDYSTDGAEALTGLGLLCRYLLGQTPADTPVMERHAALVAAHPPLQDPAQPRGDVYAWFFATHALYQAGGERWTAWERELKRALLDTQARVGCAKGSWDPSGPWGPIGGRVYSTALSALCLEAEFRYARVAQPAKK